MKYDGKLFTIQRTAGGTLLTFTVRIIRTRGNDDVLIENVPGSPVIYGWVKFSELTEIT